MCGKAAILSAGIGLSGCLGNDSRNKRNLTSGKLGGTFIEGASGADAEPLTGSLPADANLAWIYFTCLDGFDNYEQPVQNCQRWLKNDIKASDDGLLILSPSGTILNGATATCHIR